MDLAGLLLGANGGGSAPLSSASSTSGVSFGASGNAVSGGGTLPWIVAGAGAVLIVLLLILRRD